MFALFSLYLMTMYELIREVFQFWILLNFFSPLSGVFHMHLVMDYNKLFKYAPGLKSCLLPVEVTFTKWLVFGVLVYFSFNKHGSDRLLLHNHALMMKIICILQHRPSNYTDLWDWYSLSPSHLIYRVFQAWGRLLSFSSINQVVVDMT